VALREGLVLKISNAFLARRTQRSKERKEENEFFALFASLRSSRDSGVSVFESFS
jgi:hypothetical protein